MSKKKNPMVFFDVSIGGDLVERIIIEVSQKPAAGFFYSVFFPCFFLWEHIWKLSEYNFILRIKIKLFFSKFTAFCRCCS